LISAQGRSSGALGHGPLEEGWSSAAEGGDDSDRRPKVEDRDKGPARALDPHYKENGTSSPSGIEPYQLEKGKERDSDVK